MHELCKKYGSPVISATMADILDYSDRLFRVKLANIPDGEWQAESFLDHDGTQESCARYSVSLHKKNSSLIFDYSSSDPQLPAFINCTYGGLYAGTFVAVLSFLCGDIPWNSGIMRNIKIISEEGTINNARFPAPVSGALESIWSTANVATSAIGKMLICSEAEFNNAMAVWQGSSQVYNLFGVDKRGAHYSSMLIYSGLGGSGARVIGDGYDNGGPINSPCYTMINVENAESLYPLIFLYRRRAADSGGPGTMRGGVSAESAITPHGTDLMSIRLTTSGSDHSHSAGLAGGYPGGASIGRLKRGALSTHTSIPTTWEQLQGATEALTSKSRFNLSPGDVFSATPHGGGGYGDPLDRNPEFVRADILTRCVTASEAARLYGVIVQSVTNEIDWEGTKAKRRAIRADRLGGKEPAIDIDRCSHLVACRQGPVLSGEHWSCGACGHRLGHQSENWNTACVRRARPTGAAGPWVSLRYSGDSPRVQLIEFICPTCAHLIFVDQRRKDETAPHQDFKIG
jgi:N-methylhydantoinase B